MLGVVAQEAARLQHGRQRVKIAGFEGNQVFRADMGGPFDFFYRPAARLAGFSQRFANGIEHGLKLNQICLKSKFNHKTQSRALCVLR